MKQDEINEAALEFSRDIYKSSRITLTEDVFKAGVEFAQSKLYSEEEVLSFLVAYESESKNHIRLTARDWFSIKKKK